MYSIFVMKISHLVLLLVSLFACSQNDMGQITPGPSEQQVFATDASGRQYPGLDPYKIYCGPGWGRKFCRFLGKYDGTKWSNTGSQIHFSNFSSNETFISFSNLDNIVPHGQAWKLGETIDGDNKWNIKIKRDEEELLWIGFDYYGDTEEIIYSSTYICEVIDNVLHFSNTDGQSLTFFPS